MGSLREAWPAMPPCSSRIHTLLCRPFFCQPFQMSQLRLPCMNVKVIKTWWPVPKGLPLRWLAREAHRLANRSLRSYPTPLRLLLLCPCHSATPCLCIVPHCLTCLPLTERLIGKFKLSRKELVGQQMLSLYHGSGSLWDWVFWSPCFLLDFTGVGQPIWCKIQVFLAYWVHGDFSAHIPLVRCYPSWNSLKSHKLDIYTFFFWQL